MGNEQNQDVYVEAADVLSRMGAVLMDRDAGPGGKHILVACAPKSGSTYLANCLGALPGFLKADLCFGYGSREQELCVYRAAAMHAVDYVAQHHVRYSETTAQFMRAFGIFPVVIVRNLFDTVVSLRDHVRARPAPSPMAYVDERFLTWDEGRQLDFIIDFMLPWYANFLMCWSHYEGPGVRMLYRDFVGDPQEMLISVAAAAGLDRPSADIAKAIASIDPEGSRFNVGRTGRGREVLSQAQIARISDMFAAYADVEDVRRVLS